MFALNYLALFVAAVVFYIIGWLWYGVLFQKTWMGLMGITPQMAEEGRKRRTKTMALGFIAGLVLCFVLALLLKAVVVTTWQGGLVLGFWVWLGFVATVMLNSVLYERRSWKLYFLNAAQYLVAIPVAAIIIAIW